MDQTNEVGGGKKKEEEEICAKKFCWENNH